MLFSTIWQKGAYSKINQIHYSLFWLLSWKSNTQHLFHQRVHCLSAPVCSALKAKTPGELSVRAAARHKWNHQRTPPDTQTDDAYINLFMTKRAIKPALRSPLCVLLLINLICTSPQLSVCRASLSLMVSDHATAIKDNRFHSNWWQMTNS